VTRSSISCSRAAPSPARIPCTIRRVCSISSCSTPRCRLVSSRLASSRPSPPCSSSFSGRS
jgi:hypothetical protein